MAYLFETAVEPALKTPLTSPNAKHLKQVCERETGRLLAQHRRAFNNHDDHKNAQMLIALIGTKA